MENSFTITTTKEVAEQIKSQCDFDDKFNFNKTCKLGEITHYTNYSTIQIIPKEDKIRPEDIFWLGRFSATR